MSLRITHDRNTPTAAVELMITRTLDDYDLEEVLADVPRDIDGVLITQGFKDLVDDAQGILDRELAGKGLQIEQLTGAICPDGTRYRPGLWLVLREAGAAAGQPMSAEAQTRVAAAAESLRSRLGLS